MLDDLYDRIPEIAETIRRARDRETATHVLIGAGCSKSAGIPLASELIQEIRKKYPNRCRDLPVQAKNLYGLCMAQLLANERRDLINPHIQRAKMNWAHIALAQMMKTGFVDRVLTVNFDSLIQQACALVGLQPAVYDFGVAPFDEFSRLVDPAVVYLHGQSYGFTILNTVEETEEHARKLVPILRDTLNRAPLLAVGYSGSADGIFSTIERDYTRREAFYWVDLGGCPAEAEAFFTRNNHHHCRYVGNADADFFFFKLAEELGCWPPRIFSNPVEHILELIEPIIPFPADPSTPKGYDLLARTRGDLLVLKKEYERRKIPSIESTVLTGTSSDVAKFAPTTSAGRRRLSKSDRALIVSALIDEGRKLAAQATSSSSAEAVSIIDSALVKFRQAFRVQRNYPSAVNYLTRYLIERGRLSVGSEAVKYFREAANTASKVGRFSGTNSILYANWCWALIDLGQRTPGEDGARLLREAVERGVKAAEIDPKNAYAVSAWCRALIDLGRRTPGDDGVRLLREAVERGAKGAEIDPKNANAFSNWCSALIELGRRTPGDDGVRLLREAVEPGAKAAEIDPKNAYAVSAWCRSLLNLGRRTPGEDGVRLLREAVERGAKGAEIDPKNATAFSNWCWALIGIGRRTPGDDGVRLLREAVERGAMAAEIDPKNAYAVSAWCWALLDLGRRTPGEDGVRLLREAVERGAKAAEIAPKNADAFSNWCWALIELGQRTPGDDGVRLLREAIERGAKAAEIDPKNAYAVSAWCWALIDLGQRTPGEDGVRLLHEAIERGETSSNLDPSGWDAYTNSAAAMIELARRLNDIDLIVAAERNLDKSPTDLATNHIASRYVGLAHLLGAKHRLPTQRAELLGTAILLFAQAHRCDRVIWMHFAIGQSP